MKTIPLSQGQQALVDDEDYAELSQFKWTAQRSRYSFYAARYEGKKYVYMHRAIMQPGPGLEIDHKDGNKLNNLRSNLRIATRAQNMRGFLRNRVTKTSRYRGVHFYHRDNKWHARITFESKSLHLGYFELEFAAALAYDRKCRELFGNFASPNFPIS